MTSEDIHEEEILEDVSLCDLPKEEDEEEEEKEKEKQVLNIDTDPQEEFAFGPTFPTDSLSAAASQMCAADDVFFRGQILPIPIRSESMDRASSFKSISRSSSCSSRTSSAEPRLRTWNQFHSHPSPKPYVRGSTSRGSSTIIERLNSSGKAKHLSKSNSVWDFFRVGLVRTPELELQEIKVKILRSNSRAKKSSSDSNPVSRSSSSSGHNSDNNASNSNAEKQNVRMNFLSNGCKCSAEAVASDVLISVNKTKLGHNNKKYYLLDDDHDNGEKKKHNLKDQGRRKQAVSHHRTYEWLKELSHANLPMHV